MIALWAGIFFSLPREKFLVGQEKIKVVLGIA